MSIKKGVFLLFALILLIVLIGNILHKYELEVNNKDFKFYAKIITGDTTIAYKYIPVFNLNYVPNPNYSHPFEFQHVNKQGYRGNEVSLFKPKKTLRILFLGGSTTYCSGIKNIEGTYPEQVKSVLSKKLLSSYDSIQVINAGMEGAYTFEMIQHFQFKYCYFEPDIVVLHEGFNDAYGYDYQNYSPDYTHMNRSIELPKPIHPKLKWLFRTKITSWIIIKLFYKDFDILFNEEISVNSSIPKWFNLKTEASILQHKRFNAFYNNLRHLVTLVRVNGAIPILMPMTYDSANNYFQQNKIMVNAIEAHNALMDSLSSELQVKKFGIHAATIPSKYYLDPVHLDSAGNLIKAELISSVIINL
jgi:hypothetical protein